ncbi:hypothetical protein SLEP1_g6868 [Rubroshorea leprosula]|uniref:Rapid ALkalinization Factor n=1 Tax=Rubroshorea leprosula TaxID=152421 RepID=A0AAV5HWL0_9ROSI|nr:hypothetical protein SLEP1_g6868 [Rubroshorea leprosula]
MDRCSLIIFCFLVASILFIAGVQSGNEQSKGQNSKHSSPTAPSQGQKNPPAAHQNSPFNSGSAEVCSNYAALNGNNKPTKSCYPAYPRTTGRGEPIRCIPGRGCRGG